jgi:hypothetical protein
MNPERRGAVNLSGGATVDMQQCYVEVRAMAYWTQVVDGRSDTVSGRVHKVSQIKEKQCPAIR